MLTKVKDVAAILAFVSVAVFFLNLNSKLNSVSNNLDFAKLTTTISERDAQVKDVLANIAKTSETINRFTADTYFDNYAITQRTLQTVGEIHETIGKVRKEVIPSTGLLLAETTRLASSTTADLGSLTKATTASLNRTAAVSDKLESLIGTVELQVQGNGESLMKTLDTTNTALADFNKLVNNPSVVGTLSNVEAGTKSTAEAMQSVDTALRPLRKPMGWGKKIFFTALGMFRINLI